MSENSDMFNGSIYLSSNWEPIINTVSGMNTHRNTQDIAKQRTNINYSLLNIQYCVVSVIAE